GEKPWRAREIDMPDSISNICSNSGVFISPPLSICNALRREVNSSSLLDRNSSLDNRSSLILSSLSWICIQLSNNCFFFLLKIPEVVDFIDITNMVNLVVYKLQSTDYEINSE